MSISTAIILALLFALAWGCLGALMALDLGARRKVRVGLGLAFGIGAGLGLLLGLALVWWG